MKRKQKNTYTTVFPPFTMYDIRHAVLVIHIIKTKISHL
jgi:hypothetical protein